MAEQAKSQSSSSSSALRLIVMIVVFIAAIVAVKFIFGFAMAILKWAIIAAVALGITWFVLRRWGKKS